MRGGVLSFVSCNPNAIEKSCTPLLYAKRLSFVWHWPPLISRGINNSLKVSCGVPIKYHTAWEPFLAMRGFQQWNFRLLPTVENEVDPNQWIQRASRKLPNKLPTVVNITTSIPTLLLCFPNSLAIKPFNLKPWSHWSEVWTRTGSRRTGFLHCNAPKSSAKLLS